MVRTYIYLLLSNPQLVKQTQLHCIEVCEYMYVYTPIDIVVSILLQGFYIIIGNPS